MYFYLVRGAFSIYQIHPLTPSPAPGLAHYLPTIHASQRPGRVLYFSPLGCISFASIFVLFAFVLLIYFNFSFIFPLSSFFLNFPPFSFPISQYPFPPGVRGFLIYAPSEAEWGIPRKRTLARSSTLWSICFSPWPDLSSSSRWSQGWMLLPHTFVLIF